MDRDYLLQIVGGGFRYRVMFDLVVNGRMITGLVDFDRIILALEGLDNGISGFLYLRDWIDEETFLGSLSFTKESDSELTIRDSQTIPAEYKSQIITYLSYFFTVEEVIREAK